VIKENELGVVCGTQSSEEKCVQSSVDKLERTDEEELGIDCRMIFGWILQQ
jgi:hypothetical protein